MADTPIPPPPPPPEGSILPHQENANFFLYTVDFYRTVIEEVIGKVPPMELPFILGFLQGAIESQQGIAAGAFEESREFFRALYPPLLAGHVEMHPEEAPEENQLLIIIPTPAPMAAINPEEPGRIVLPGSKGVN